MLRLRQLACAQDLCPRQFIEEATTRGIVGDRLAPASGIGKDQERELQLVLYANRQEECTVCFDVSELLKFFHRFWAHIASQAMDEPRITGENAEALWRRGPQD